MEEPSSVTTVLSQYNISAYVCDSSAVGCILVLHFNSAKESDSTELKCSTLGGSTAVITRLTSEACHSFLTWFLVILSDSFTLSLQVTSPLGLQPSHEGSATHDTPLGVQLLVPG